MLNFCKKIYQNSLNIFFPYKCVVCGSYGSLCCQNCLSKIEKIMTPTCPGCGKISKNSMYCRSCRPKFKTYLYSVDIACNYHSEVIKKIIHDFKYDGVVDLTQYCGELIYQRIHKNFETRKCLIVPVPLHRYKKNLRGFNQAELIARYLSKRMNLPGGDVLMRKVHTRNQAVLTRQQRLTNLVGAFDCIDPEFVKDKEILLIDDVMTTGTTLNECAKVLKAAGAKRIYAAVLARNIG